jgi:hypothetical protein
MNSLINFLENHGDPRNVKKINSYFKFREGDFEFCPDGKECDLLRTKAFTEGQYPPPACDQCINNYIQSLNISVKYKCFLYKHFSTKDLSLVETTKRSWIKS